MAVEIQSKIDGLGAHEELLLGGPEFILNQQIPFWGGEQVRSLGAFKTTVKSDVDSTTTPVDVGDSNTVILRDFPIDGNKANNGSNHCLNIGTSRESEFRNLRLLNAGKHATVSGQLQYSRFESVTVKSPTNRGTFYNTGNPIYNSHHNLHFQDIPGEAIHIKAGKTCILISATSGRPALACTRMVSIGFSSQRVPSFRVPETVPTSRTVVTSKSVMERKSGVNGGHGVLIDGSTGCQLPSNFGSNDQNNNENNDVLAKQSAAENNSVGNKVVNGQFDYRSGNVGTSVVEGDSNQASNIFDNLQWTGGYSANLNSQGANGQTGIAFGY